MAEVMILEEQEISGFTTDNANVMTTTPLVTGKTYIVTWDGTPYTCTAYETQVGATEGNPIYSVFLGNRECVEWLMGGQVGDMPEIVEPFALNLLPAEYTNLSTDAIHISCVGAMLGGCAEDMHRVGIYEVTGENPEEPDEPEAPQEGIVLKDRKGNDVAHYGIETVTFDTTTEGKQQTFTKGVAVEGLEIVPDFLGGDMAISAGDGVLVKSAVIHKPADLSPENVRRGKTIAGIDGDFIGDTEEMTADLAMADGDQVIVPSADGKVISRVTVKKPETLVPENIAKDVEIGGVIGKFEGGGGVDWTDQNLKFFTYQIDAENKQIILYSILYDVLFETTGTYDVNIPNQIGGLDVVIACV